MTIDHVGILLLNNDLSSRIIGRLAFPLFAWLIANGSKYSHHLNKYILRLSIFAFLSQPIYALVFNLESLFEKLNIIFTLLVGVLAIKVYKSYISRSVKVLFLILLIISSFYINYDYGLYGILSILLFYIYFDNLKFIVISQILLLSLIYYVPKIFFVERFDYLQLIQIFSLASLFIIGRYNQNIGPKFQYFFYIFYPLHLLVIYMLGALLN